jgi:hypothetical protein
MEITIGQDDFSGPPTDEDVDAFSRVLLRLYKQGKTLEQVKTALVSGITSTV